jgi:hypothetical protein
MLIVAVCLSACLVAGAAEARSPAACGPNDRTEPALQGQVPIDVRKSGAAEPGYWCNLELVGGYRSLAFANFETYKNCAYYTDNVGGIFAEGGGVVLDLSDPRHPVKTAYLTARAMGNAGESLRIHRARGLLVADHYSVLGVDPRPIQRSLAVYDVSKDCAHPKLLADVQMPSAVGHEGCFDPDGMVYYMGSVATITPIDLSDPTHPRQLSDPWPLSIHGCSISDDGKRGYFADLLNGKMLVVDTSQAHARMQGAKPHVISKYATPDSQFQQATYPLDYNGHPYVVNWSEATIPPKVCLPGRSTFAYARILDLADEAHPTEASKIQTEVMKPENCQKVVNDSTGQFQGVDRGDPFYILASGLFLYDTHMCTPDRLHNPTILACAQFGSGLRVFDIRDPHRPSEIAYYNTGTVTKTEQTLDWAIARPVIRSDLGEIWWATNLEGFHVAKFRDGVWPFAGMDRCPAGDDYFQRQYDLGYDACQEQRATNCTSRRAFTISLRGSVRARVKRVRVYVDGKLVRRLNGARSSVRVDLSGRKAGRRTVTLQVRTVSGKIVRLTRRYRLCSATASASPRAASDPPQPLADQLPADALRAARASTAQQLLLLCHLAGPAAAAAP